MSGCARVKVKKKKNLHLYFHVSFTNKFFLHSFYPGKKKKRLSWPKSPVLIHCRVEQS